MLVVLMLAPLSARADTPDWTWDPAHPAAVPSWIQVVNPPADSTSSLATQQFKINPPDAAAELVVTICYGEVEGGFLRVSWQSDSTAVWLSENLYEGVALPNRRALRIPLSVLHTDGLLTLQASQADLKVSKILFSWVTPRAVLVDSALGPVVAVDRFGAALHEQDLNGEVPSEVDDDIWNGNVVTAPLSLAPVRIENGVGFEFELEKAPQQSRLVVQVEGLPMESSLYVWLNGKPAGVVEMAVPSLSDPGYYTNAAGVMEYAGWRQGSVLVPAQLLQPGTNQLQFSWTASPDPALAVKDLKLELFYPPAP